MKIESSVNVLDFVPGRGCYVWVDPHPKSLITIDSLLQYYPEKPNNGTELHVTLIYSKDLPILSDIVVKDRFMSGWITGVELWKDHKDRDILVANIKSQSLLEVHDELKSVGLVHSYDDFLPHMTLAYKVINPGVVNAWISNISSIFPLPIFFGSTLKATSVR